MVLEELRTDDHEQVSFFYDRASGLEAIVAIHDTTRGPALGGVRLLPYETETEALADVLRLSVAMSYKAAAAELDFGGGKAVIVADPEEKDEALFREFGRAVSRLGGNYITAEDVNTGVADLDVVAEETEHVIGTSDGLGDPSPVTAHGVVHGMQAALREQYGDPSFEDVDVLIQGVGKVGSELAERLADRGANVAVSDPDPDSRRRLFDRLGEELPVVDPDAAFEYPCDVFAPCAVGRLGLGERGSLADAIDRLECDVVAGSANNVLGDRSGAKMYAERLAERDILYAPDYVINAGGLISAAHEWRGNRKEAAYEEAERIEKRLAEISDAARTEGVTTLEAADRYAERRLEAGSPASPIPGQ